METAVPGLSEAALDADPAAGQAVAPGRRLTRNRAFTIFWAGQAISSLGDAVAIIALPLLVLQATGSIVQMGLVTGVAGVGQFVSGLFSGVLVDRVDRRRLMIVCNMGLLLLFAAIPVTWALVGAQLWLIYVVMLFAAALGSCSGIAYVAAIPNLVDADQIVDANARLQVSMAVTFVSGPILAGILASRLSPALAIGVDAVSFAFAALSLTLIRLRPSSGGAGTATRRDFRHEFMEGARFLLDQPLLRTVVALLLVYALLTGAAFDLFIYHLKHDLGLSTAAVGVVFGVAAMGGVLSGIVAPLLRRRWGFAPGFLGGLAVVGLAIIGVGLSVSVAIIALSALAFVFGDSTRGIYSMTLRQEVTPDHLLGRVTALVWTSLFAVAPIGAVLTTTAAAHIGTSHTLLLGGSLMILLAAAGLLTPARVR
jgi:MFS family permease